LIATIRTGHTVGQPKTRYDVSTNRLQSYLHPPRVCNALPVHRNQRKQVLNLAADRAQELISMEVGIIFSQALGCPNNTVESGIG
jgi:hypothetical protein